MNKNNIVDTAQKGQTTTKNNIPADKVKTLANATERRKEREEQFRNFRINALKRRCKRYGFDDEKTAKYVEALKKQMDAPKEYSILIIYTAKDFAAMKEAISNAKLSYKMASETYLYIDGNQNVLTKLREIAPPSAKIFPRAKKMESVIPKEEREVIKKPSANTAEKKTAAKAANKGHTPKSKRYMHRLQKGRRKNIRTVYLAYKRSKKQRATTVRLNAKKSSADSKKASMNVKKAA